MSSGVPPRARRSRRGLVDEIDIQYGKGSLIRTRPGGDVNASDRTSRVSTGVGVALVAALSLGVGVALQPVVAQGTSYLTQTFRIGAATPYNLMWPADDGASDELLYTDGTGLLRWAPPRWTCLESDTTQNATDDGTEETLWTYSLPANTLDENDDSLEILVAGTFAADGDTKTIDLTFGSTDIGAITTTNQTAFRINATLVRTGVGSQKASAEISITDRGGTITNTTSTEDETGAITISLTGDGTNASDIVYEMARVCVSDAP